MRLSTLGTSRPTTSSKEHTMKNGQATGYKKVLSTRVKSNKYPSAYAK